MGLIGIGAETMTTKGKTRRCGRPVSDTPLARARLAAGYASQVDAARLAGVSQSSWAGWEGQRAEDLPSWKLSTFRRIAKVIGRKATIKLFAELLAGESAGGGLEREKVDKGHNLEK